MNRLAWRRLCAIALLAALMFSGVQGFFVWRAFGARIIAFDYLAHDVCGESQPTVQHNFFAKGRDRWTLQIPPFRHHLPLHDIEFEWNPNRHIPPDGATPLEDVWLGTCILVPKSPWRHVDILGILGPIRCSVYGDWHVTSSR